MLYDSARRYKKYDTTKNAYLIYTKFMYLRINLYPLQVLSNRYIHFK